jgi:pimeloyl-ACP methyl ester carboxylesterase
VTQYRSHTYAGADGGPLLFARDYPAAGLSEGPALLLMHGLTRNSADFEPLAARLAGRYRLIVPDQRGRGLSANDPDPGNYRPDVYAADMFALLAGLGIERATLIGTSMGGLVATVMAALDPARVQAVVLNDIGPVLEPAGLARIGTYVGDSAPLASWDEAARRAEAINAHAFPEFTHADWLAFARRICREEPSGSIAFAYDPAIALGFEAEDDAAPVDLWPLWQSLGDKPVLVIRGAHSDLLSPATLARMEELHAGPFEAAEVPGRGHAPLLDEPAALAAIEPFLERHAS